MAPIAEADLPLLELLAAAPERLLDIDKIEPLALLAAAHQQLSTARYLVHQPANGHAAAAPQLRAAFHSALGYRAVFLSGDRYGLTEDGGLYLRHVGVDVSDDTRRFVAENIGRPVAELQAEADALLTV